jgi:protein-L-isoaspartate(D-aspartate) O-methyltransferase
MTLEDCRRHYAQEIRLTACLRSTQLVEAFARVPREKYLGPGPWRILELARSRFGRPLSFFLTEDPSDLYHDVLVAIDVARKLNNGQPSALACWIEALHLQAGQRVFHLGCGVGYYTAILAELVGPGGSVAAIEVLPELAARARANLSGYPQVSVQAGDGTDFDPGACDAVLVNAGVTHPDPLWLDRLTESGRIVLPLTTTSAVAGLPGVMIRIARLRGGFSAEVVSGVAIYSCTTLRDPEMDRQVAAALKSGTLKKMKSLRRDVHAPTETCLVHGLQTCLSAAEGPAG